MEHNQTLAECLYLAGVMLIIYAAVQKRHFQVPKARKKPVHVLILGCSHVLLTHGSIVNNMGVLVCSIRVSNMLWLFISKI